MNNTVLIVVLVKLELIEITKIILIIMNLFYNSSKFKLLGGVDINKKMFYNLKNIFKAYLNFKKHIMT